MTAVAALCSGYGGLELGLQLAGVDVELRWYAEIDRHASQVMAHHYPDVPNLGDLTKIADPPPVDVVAAGFPCQPVSHAGKRKGVNDARWLIDDVCQLARRADARWLLLENVSGIFTANRGEAFYRVLAALAENGFDAEWTSVRASDVGAPHQRLRWFLLAYTDESGREARFNEGHDSERSRSQSVGSSAPAGYADGVAGTQAVTIGRRSRPVGEPGEVTGALGSDGASGATAAADTDGQRSQGRPAKQRPDQRPAGTDGMGPARFGPYADAINRWEPIIGRPAPEPTDSQRRLNPRFVEWMMGLPDGWVCDAVEGRSHQLRILGNGVVPQQAAYALRLLNEQVAS